MTSLLIRQAHLRDRRLVDVRIDGGRIAAVAPVLTRTAADEQVLDADGATLLPGLHDHHLHLLATAAAQGSVQCGPPRVRSEEMLAAELRRVAARSRPGEWIRAVGYHESVGGQLDRDRLDRLVPDRPVRVQHRSGALWVLNSLALEVVGADAAGAPAGVERDATGRLTGRLWRADRWLRDQLGLAAIPDLRRLGRELAARGVTGVTDASPDMDDATLNVLADAIASGAIPQRMHLLGADRLPTQSRQMSLGPRKVVLADHDLPDLPDLIEQLAHARRSLPGGVRPVAVHCVTRAALVLLCTALDEIGTVPGDRVEHASVVPGELIGELRRLGLTVVTQPGFIAERGDDYLRDVDHDDLDGLYRHASLLAAGVPVGLSTDAPYGPPNPWHAVSSASDRRTPRGEVVGAAEAVPLETALDGFLTQAGSPGGAPREVVADAVADLCVVDDPDAASPRVRLSLVGGRVIYATDPGVLKTVGPA